MIDIMILSRLIPGEREEKMDTFYIAKPEYEDEIYGSECPVCLSLCAIAQLAAGWEMTADELLEQMDVATPEQIAEFGTLDHI